jgi:ribonuclease HI
MAKKRKYYVVWKGRRTGVFSDWSDCREQIAGFPAAEYKAFETRSAAEEAFRGDYAQYRGVGKRKKRSRTDETHDEAGVPTSPSLAVDAACSMNVGPLEYQGVLTETGEVAFRKGPFADGTNNVGEFLAIVHGLAYLAAEGSDLPIYSDSAVAIKWVQDGRARTTLARTGRNGRLFQLIARAERWLKEHDFRTPILKWNTRAWGEIPADFGRK